MTLDEVKARIRTLQARTSANGCTEAEAMAAAEAVLRLMREHGLDNDQVACSPHFVDLGRRKDAPIDLVWGRLAYVCRCQSWRRKRVEDWAIAYFGREPWPEIAAWLHSVVQGADDRARKAFLKSPAYKARRTKRTRAAARRAFADGFAIGILRQLTALIDAQDAEQRDADHAIAQRALDKLGIEFAAAKKVSVSLGGRFAREREAGQTAGRATELRMGVRGGGQQLTIAGPKG